MVEVKTLRDLALDWIERHATVADCETVSVPRFSPRHRETAKTPMALEKNTSVSPFHSVEGEMMKQLAAAWLIARLPPPRHDDGGACACCGGDGPYLPFVSGGKRARLHSPCLDALRAERLRKITETRR
jgi:hypothetical protein